MKKTATRRNKGGRDRARAESGTDTRTQLTIESPAFLLGGPIPGRHTADGENISPPLQWSGVPAGARSLVLIMDDPDAPGPPTPFTHWLVYGLPASVPGLPEHVPPLDAKVLPRGAAQGRNSFGGVGYGGPAPPRGKPHRYRFTLFALDQTVNLRPGADRRDAEEAVAGHVLAEGELVGVYGR